MLARAICSVSTGCFAEEKNLLLLLGIKPWIVQFVA